MTKAPRREARFRTTIRPSRDIVTRTGNSWARVRYIPLGRAHILIPSETDSPCPSTGTGTTFAPTLEKAMVAPTYAGSSTQTGSSGFKSRRADRKSVVSGKSVDLGGRRIIKKNKNGGTGSYKR